MDFFFLNPNRNIFKLVGKESMSEITDSRQRENKVLSIPSHVCDEERAFYLRFSVFKKKDNIVYKF